MIWFFLFFFISGFCSILYELVWLRLAMAQFGVNTPLTSIVLSVFMAGMGLGSWLAGRFVRRSTGGMKASPLQLYALSEFLIGCSALIVPLQLGYGHHLLAGMAGHVAMSSASFYWASGSWLALNLIPWCACMGATIPLGMGAIRNEPRFLIRKSFSFLYVANVLGAIIGTFVPLMLIEGYGFHGALKVGAVLNLAIATGAFSLDRVMRSAPGTQPHESKTQVAMSATPVHAPDQRNGALVLLFLTGLATMGMEIIWIRLFTCYAGPLVYAFAAILMAYLVGTLIGSRVYRIWSRKNFAESRLLWVALAPLGLLPLLTGDIRFGVSFLMRVMLGIAPFAGVIGFLTPMLVDRWSGGDPDRAGRAYAVNILGCIAGPLLSGFILLPIFGERVSIVIFVLPWVTMAIPTRQLGYLRPARAWTAAVAMMVAAAMIFSLSHDYETVFPDRKVIRDSTATVIATGSGLKKFLIVNGTGMTEMSPITKMMAHLALSSTQNPPKSALIICFGMGTTFRSTLNWGIPTTVVELVPSVPKLFTYYHADGDQYLNSPNAHVVIDDGRRYLERTHDTFDVILIDPPPPVEAAGSSLLYSQEFYRAVKKHLNPGGIFQQWLPGGDDAVHASVARALKNEFPYIRVYPGIKYWGIHFLASMSPIPERTAEEHLARMPQAAVTDLMEWGPASTPEDEFNRILVNEMTIDHVISYSPQTVALQDDRPVNEYFMMRHSAHSFDEMEKELGKQMGKQAASSAVTR
jgi:spermidine synthase